MGLRYCTWSAAGRHSTTWLHASRLRRRSGMRSNPPRLQNQPSSSFALRAACGSEASPTTGRRLRRWRRSVVSLLRRLPESSTWLQRCERWRCTSGGPQKAPVGCAGSRPLRAACWASSAAPMKSSYEPWPRAHEVWPLQRKSSRAFPIDPYKLGNIAWRVVGVCTVHGSVLCSDGFV